MWKLLALVALVVATPASAQNANVYNGTAHEPNPAAVQSQEKAAGVSPAPAQQKQLDDSVEQLDKQVQRNAQDAGAKAAACAKNPSNC